MYSTRIAKAGQLREAPHFSYRRPLRFLAGTHRCITQLCENGGRPPTNALEGRL